MFRLFWFLLGWRQYRCGCWHHPRRLFHCSHPEHYRERGPAMARWLEARGHVRPDSRPLRHRGGALVVDES